LDLATAEATNLHAVAVAVAAAALARAESRGCHRWRDLPPAGWAQLAGPAQHTIVRVEAGQPRVSGTVKTKERAQA
jgi:aspartate oxidase